MLKLELNVKYLLLLSFLTAAEFYNLGHIQDIKWFSLLSDLIFMLAEKNQNKHSTLNSSFDTLKSESQMLKANSCRMKSTSKNCLLGKHCKAWHRSSESIFHENMSCCVFRHSGTALRLVETSLQGWRNLPLP